ncbi:SDR family oxidoreductase [bacterium]|nr:SDR family oxidoreductase [bacterium]
MKILLTGANGYVGYRLLAQLVHLGHTVVCCVRDKDRFVVPDWCRGATTVVEVDFSDAESLTAIPSDVELAYYLVHSMTTASPDFETIEQRCAENFTRTMSSTSVERVIYLSGIVNEPALSPHLASRFRVETILSNGRFSLTTLRAGIIVGSGSASFEIIRDLVEKLPFMVAPKWVTTRCQPISIHNVIDFLVGVITHPETANASYDIGGPDILSYKDMLLRFARVRQLRRYIQVVPVLTPRISSYWLYFVTSTSYPLAKHLVDSMSVEVVCSANSLASELGISLISYDDAIRIAFDKIDHNQVVSSWKDALNSNLLKRGVSSHIQIPKFGCFRDYRSVPVDNPTQTIEKIWRIGGTTGWYYANWLWTVRGAIDRLVGGVGMRRGRRSPVDIKPGDTLDCWRVLYADKAEGRLVLFAEMKLPGDAWLEFVLINGRLHQRATFRPLGVGGRLYWWAVVPFHHFIFNGMLNRLGRSDS